MDKYSEGFTVLGVLIVFTTITTMCFVSWREYEKLFIRKNSSHSKARLIKEDEGEPKNFLVKAIERNINGGEDKIIKWHEVYATRIGLIGNTTYSGAYLTPESTLVALPSKGVQKRYVEVVYKNKAVIVQVLDLGPWSRNDPYWENNQKPKAELGICDKDINNGTAKNKSGIDLSDGLWDKLGIKRGTGIVKVRWRFVPLKSDASAVLND